MTSFIFNLAKRRKTVRKFSKNTLDLNRVRIALEVAGQAPSGANVQPWRFMIITSSHIKKKVRKACEQGEKTFYSHVKGELKDWLLQRAFDWKKPFLEEAPILLLVLSETRAPYATQSVWVLSETRAPYATQSVWVAIGYLLLVLEELGLSTVTYTPSDAKALQEAMGIPEEYRLEVVLQLGVSQEAKKKEPRLSIDEVTYLNHWGQKFIIK
jgi:nitroreductase